ncbi:MAG: carboxypeptidase regulatory-like domain-containing protein, partial [Acidobacteria bacterium]|nr:carboxypeptidase regulatory-like domain-containing protein [Acidobacteriota bacterium]
NPAVPQARGTLAPVNQRLFNPRDVTLVQSRAYVVTRDHTVAGFPPGLYAIDISNPDTPHIIGTDTAGFFGTDFEVRDQIGMAAAQGTGVAAVPLFSLPAGAAPLYIGAIVVSSTYREGTGIATTDELIFETVNSVEGLEHGSTGDSALVIAQYRQPADLAGIAPTLTLASPADGEELVQGDQILVKAMAQDDVGVAQVDLKANGITIASLTKPPYQVSYTVPAHSHSITFEATAFDYAANRGDATPVVGSVIEDPLTTVIGQVVDSQGYPIVNATVTVTGTPRSAVTDTQGGFSIPGVGTIPLGVEISVRIANELGEQVGESTLFVRASNHTG